MKYNDKIAIKEACDSLEQINKLIRERHIAGYDRKERLNEFVIFGNFYLDTCGNCMTAEGFIPKIQVPNIPDVLTIEEFWGVIETFDNITKPGVLSKKEINERDFDWAHNKRPFPTMMSWSENLLPPAHVICPICQKEWTVKNCHDVVRKTDTEILSLKKFIGKTLNEVKEVFVQKTDARYFMQKEIRNDKHIDLINKKGWIDIIVDDYTIQEGDDGCFNVSKYFHSQCNQIFLLNSELKSFQNIFFEAGYVNSAFITIPNEYCSCSNCGPWFNIITPTETFKIGWRKRVINIECSSINFLNLFPQEDVTKKEHMIHAWGPKKAIEYLKKIRESTT